VSHYLELLTASAAAKIFPAGYASYRNTYAMMGGDVIGLGQQKIAWTKSLYIFSQEKQPAIYNCPTTSGGQVP
jgi:hypothetical protein